LCDRLCDAVGIRSSLLGNKGAIALTLKLHSNNAAGEIWKKAAKPFI